MTEVEPHSNAAPDDVLPGVAVPRQRPKSRLWQLLAVLTVVALTALVWAVPAVQRRERPASGRRDTGGSASQR